MRFFKRKKQPQTIKTDPIPNNETVIKPIEGVRSKLYLLMLFVLFSPLVFALIFNFIQSLDVSFSEFTCYITEPDYLTLIALQSGKNATSAFMPFSLWKMTNIIIMQFVAIILLIYEIHVMIANRKKKVKESLLKRHKRVIFNFFSCLLLLYVISDHYISIKRPQAIQQAQFLADMTAGKQAFFANCDSTGDIHIGKESKLVKKDNTL